MSKNSSDVPRPYRKSDYRIRFATREAERGWRDLCATTRGASVTAWEFLTSTPTDQRDDCYPLKDELGVVVISGVKYTRWQYKPTSGGRIWYAVLPAAKGAGHAGVVALERVTTGHPNETIKNHR